MRVLEEHDADSGGAAHDATAGEVYVPKQRPNRFLPKIGLLVLLTGLSVAGELLRGQFYYAASPYLYPVFYIFASVFMGPIWGLLTCVASITITHAVIDPADSLGPVSLLIHCLQALWLGIQSKKTNALQPFTDGLKFWLWCGTPLLCLAAFPYFREFFWSGAAIVAHEINGNLLSLVVFSLVFYSSNLRRRCLWLSQAQPEPGRHSISYSFQLAVASLIILPCTTMLILDHVIRHSANNNDFTRISKTTAALYSQTLQARSDVLSSSIRLAFSTSPNADELASGQVSEIFSDFKSVCGAFKVTTAAKPTIIKSSCEGMDTATFHNALAQKTVTSDSWVPPTEGLTENYWIHTAREGNQFLVLVLDKAMADEVAKDMLANVVGSEFLGDVAIEPSSDPWLTTSVQTVSSEHTAQPHFFSKRMNERYNYELPGTITADSATTGLRISFSAREFAKSRFRESGVFLSIAFSFLLALMLLIQHLTRREVSAIQQLSKSLQTFPQKVDAFSLERGSEIKEFDALSKNTHQLLNNLDAMAKQQERSRAQLETRAAQLTGMVEQSRAFLCLFSGKGERISDNRIARSNAFSGIRESVLSAARAHSLGMAGDTDDPIAAATTEWLGGTTQPHFAEIKTVLGTEDELRTLTLQFGAINDSENTYFVRIEDISDLITTKEQLAHTARLAELGELATGIAHELNQPLNAINLSATNIGINLDRNTLTDDYLREKLDRLEEQIARASNIINDLKSFARAQNLERHAVPVSRIITRAIEMVRSQFELDNISIETNIQDTAIEIMANEQKIEQVLINLFNNARHVMQPQGGGRLFVTSRRKGKNAVIVVRDTGPGVEEKLRDKIFTPFFTTRISQGGTGLGLSISHKLIQDHGGHLVLVESKTGATFELRIPMIQPSK